MTARVLRESDGTVLIATLHVARTHAERVRGLLGRDSLPPGEALWIPHCRMVHTFGMAFPIDLVYLDRRLRVRKVVPSVPSARLSACLGATSVIELPSGAARSLGLARGLQLRISENDG